MALTKATYRMINGISINVLDYGAVGDGVTDDTAAIQAAQTASESTGQVVFFPVGTYKITSTITNSNTTAIRWEGDGGGQLNYDAYPSAMLTFTGAASGDNMLELGDNTFLTIKGLVFNTSDSTETWNILKSSTTQTASAGNFRIEECTFRNIGGIALWLGGGGSGVEWYGWIEQISSQNVAQVININGHGEVVVKDCHWQTINTNTGTPVGQDAWNYFENATIHIHNSVAASAGGSDVRHWFEFKDCHQISVNENVLERVTDTDPDYDLFRISGTTNFVAHCAFENNHMIASHVVGSPAGYYIRITGGQIRHFVLQGNSFTYGTTIDEGFTYIQMDVTPEVMELGSNRRDGYRAHLIRIPDPTTSNSNVNILGGLRGTAVEYYEVVTQAFTVLDSQTDAKADIWGGGAVQYMAELYSSYDVGDSEYLQIFPISMQITSDSADAETITFKLSKDTADDEVINMSGLQSTKQMFPLRSEYSMESVPSNKITYLYYTSGLVNNTRKYIARFKYAVIRQAGFTDNGTIGFN